MGQKKKEKNIKHLGEVTNVKLISAKRDISWKLSLK